MGVQQVSGLRIIDTFDSPVVLVLSTTNVPGSGSAPLEVVATLARSCYGLAIHGTLGEVIGVYRGASGQEVLETLIGLGPDIVECFIPKGARVSLRSMKTGVVNAGDLCVQFLGFP